MLVVYYTEQDGTVMQCHKAPDKPLYELQELVADWNKRYPEKQAHIEELPDRGLTAYLFALAERRVKYTRETIEAALEALDEARSCIDGLEVAT